MSNHLNTFSFLFYSILFQSIPSSCRSRPCFHTSISISISFNPIQSNPIATRPFNPSRPKMSHSFRFCKVNVIFESSPSYLQTKSSSFHYSSFLVLLSCADKLEQVFTILGAILTAFKLSLVRTLMLLVALGYSITM